VTPDRAEEEAVTPGGRKSLDLSEMKNREKISTSYIWENPLGVCNKEQGNNTRGRKMVET